MHSEGVLSGRAESRGLQMPFRRAHREAELEHPSILRRMREGLTVCALFFDFPSMLRRIMTESEEARKARGELVEKEQAHWALVPDGNAISGKTDGGQPLRDAGPTRF